MNVINIDMGQGQIVRAGRVPQKMSDTKSVELLTRIVKEGIALEDFEIRADGYLLKTYRKGDEVRWTN